MLRHEDYGAHFIRSITTEVTNIVGFTFVDDMDLICMDTKPSTSLIELSEQMKAVIELWKHGLRLTGVVITPEKIWLHVISFLRKASGEYY